MILEIESFGPDRDRKGIFKRPLLGEGMDVQKACGGVRFAPIAAPSHLLDTVRVSEDVT
jgi:hypothetical protein